MRITKEPEARKQEILDTALKLFGENGYEKTSITDIAKAIGVAQGLCYRYFPSKEALFDSAIEQYADVVFAIVLYTPCDIGREKNGKGRSQVPAADHRRYACHDGRSGHKVLFSFSPGRK